MDLEVKSWAVFVWVMTLVSAAGALVWQTKNNTKKIEEIEHGLNKKLFLSSGESIYMPRHSCDECRIKCQSDRSQVYEELKKTNQELKDEIKEVTKEMQNISRCLHKLSGTVEQFMQDHRNY